MTLGIGSLLAEYRAMLKSTELEEVLDLVVFRPVAYLFVKSVQHTTITPNQVTLLSLILGLVSGWCYWQGTLTGFVVGSVLLFFTNVVDCADGMLARLKNCSSVIGYILDGMVDYITHIVVFVGLLHGLSEATGRPGYIWTIGVPAGVSFAWWCAMVDRFRGEWLEKVYGRRRDPAQEIRDLQEQVRVWRNAGSHYGQRFLVALYTFYVRLWYSGPFHRTPSYTDYGIPRETWAKARRPVLRMAVFMGPTMHLSLIMLAGWLNRMEYYVWTALVFGTLWGVVVLVTRLAVDRRLLADALKGARN